jgi:acyl-CoA synthetase (AMP-forming)/AMP-acid ligase II
MGLADLLLHHPFPDEQEVLFTVNDSMTVGQARRRVKEIADGLSVEAGQAVAVQLPNGPELLCTMVAIWQREAVHVPMNEGLSEPEVQSILHETGAAAFIDSAGVHETEGAKFYPEDVAFIVWTSGTTGKPKPILHTHTAYLELLDRVLAPLRGRSQRTRPPVPNLIPVSMALNAGLYNCLFGLRAGAAVVMMGRFSPEEFGALVERFGIRSTVLPPAAMVMLTDSELQSIAPMKYVRSITAPVSPLNARRFTERFGCFVLNSYGQAEMGEVIGWTAADAKEHPEKIGAAGRPLPGVQIRIDDNGRLLVRPPNAAMGIEERQDRDGFIDTGDIASIDDQGFVWIEGRVSDLINRGGNKVFPDSVEEVLRLHPSVRDVSVVGVPDDRLGEVPVAFIVGGNISEAELNTHCRQYLVAYKIPVSFVHLDELPRSEVGKVLRRQLAQNWAAKHLG